MDPKSKSKRRSDEPVEVVDFRSMEDDAWYGAIVSSENNGRSLRVMYVNFPEAFDDKFEADRFESDQDLQAFGKRFRRSWVQLQDWECRKVVQGAEVTVSHHFGPQDVKFYDAIVDSVISELHPMVEGQCSCTFVVHWQHGPLVGEKTSTSIENICLLQPKYLKLDPTVTKFLDVARQSLMKRKPQGTQTAGHYQENSAQNLEDNTAVCGVNNPTMMPCNISGSVDYVVTEVNVASCSSVPQNEGTSKHAADSVHSPRGRMSNSGSTSDIELGSDLSRKKNAHPKKTHYFFRIENLEKDLSAYDIVDFIMEKASLTCHVSICPSVSEEFYSRATILVETEEEANRLFNFLHDPSQIVTSSGGRPWLTDEIWCGSLDGTMPKFKWSPLFPPLPRSYLLALASPRLFVRVGYAEERIEINRSNSVQEIQCKKLEQLQESPRIYVAKPNGKTQEMLSKEKTEHYQSKIKLVYEGTDEYEKGKRLQELHAAFHGHIHNLLQRLMEDEKKTIQSCGKPYNLI